jgi:hypothetical protein
VAPWLGFLARRVAWPLLGIGLGFTPAIASTVTVPDDFATVQQGIDSGADTVLVREGTYSEAPIVERQLVLQGIGVSARPQLSGLSISNRLYPLASTVIGFDIRNTVQYTTAVGKSPIRLAFSDCYMDGLLVGADNPDAGCMLTVSRCRVGFIHGGLDDVSMDADTVTDVLLSVWSNPVSIQHCWFRGGAGAGTAITLLREPYAYVGHNRIESYAAGISAAEASLTMDGNTISACGTGIDVRYEGSIRNNVIRDCGVGIYCNNGGTVEIVNNSILDASGDGISIQSPDILRISGNIIGSCGGNGIALSEFSPGGSYDVDLRSNTIFNNTGSGIVWGLQPVDDAAVQANVSYGNGGVGLSVAAGARGRLGCNDWFGNLSGAVTGVAADPTDLSVDPMFCDVANADVRLNSSSPLLADTVSCGQIGALGVGCGATPTLVQRFSAARVSGGVEIVWQVADGATASAVWVERAESETGGWTRPATERSLDNRAVVELDRSVMPERAYWYRLVAQEASATLVIGAPIVVDAAARLQFELTQVGPNPGSGPERIGFALPRASEIEIAAFDVQGRRVATLARGPWPAGAHELEWNGGTSGGGAAPPGLYILRYQYPGGQDRRAIVRVR